MGAPLRLFSGFDFGQAFDFCALAVCEQRDAGAPTPKRRHQYIVRYLRLWDRGTDYQVVAEETAEIFSRPPLTKTWLAVDFTGVGRAVASQFRAACVPAKFKYLTITGGNKATEDDATHEWGVPKRELISNAVALFYSRLVKVAPIADDRMRPADRQRNPTAMSDRLKYELSRFRVKQNRMTGSESFEAEKESDHDDLVSALAMAIYLGERNGGGGAAGIRVQSEAASAVSTAPPGVFA